MFGHGSGGAALAEVGVELKRILKTIIVKTI